MNIRHFKALLFLVICCFVFVSCKKEDSKIEENEIVQEEFIEETIIEESKETIVLKPDDENVIVENVEEEIKFGPTELFEINNEFIVDINQDDESEILKFVKNEEESLFFVNEKSFVIDTNGLEDYFFMLDLNKEDSSIEIVFPYYDEYEKEFSIWYNFNGEKFVEIGYTKGVPNDGIYFNEDSSFTIYERVEILETNFIPYTYDIIDNKIVQRKEELYQFGLNRLEPLKNNVELNVWLTKNKEGEMFTIPKNSDLSYTCTDGKEWINIIYNGNTYWLNIEEDILVDNDDSFTWEVFSNLIIAE